MLRVVDRLLADPRVDPAAGTCAAFTAACRRGALPFARRLLEDPRVRVPPNALIEALEGRQYAVAAWLLSLQDSEPHCERLAVNAAAGRNAALRAVLALLADSARWRRTNALARGEADGDQPGHMAFREPTLPGEDGSLPPGYIARLLLQQLPVLQCLAGGASRARPRAAFLHRALGEQQAGELVAAGAAALAGQAWRRRRAALLARAATQSRGKGTR